MHTLFSAFHALVRRWDVVYVCNSANVPAAILLCLARERVVLNVDGLEWQRKKWGAAGRASVHVRGLGLSNATAMRPSSGAGETFGAGPGRARYIITRPPSTPRTCPVM